MLRRAGDGIRSGSANSDLSYAAYSKQKAWFSPNPTFSHSSVRLSNSAARAEAGIEVSKMAASRNFELQRFMMMMFAVPGAFQVSIRTKLELTGLTDIGARDGTGRYRMHAPCNCRLGKSGASRKGTSSSLAPAHPRVSRRLGELGELGTPPSIHWSPLELPAAAALRRTSLARGSFVVRHQGNFLHLPVLILPDARSEVHVPSFPALFLACLHELHLSFHLYLACASHDCRKLWSFKTYCLAVGISRVNKSRFFAQRTAGAGMVRIVLPRSFPRHWGSIRAASKYTTQGNVSSFSTSSKRLAYEDTIGNLKIGTHTRVIYQGFTGRQATANAKESIEYGTNVVGGVKPGVTGEHLGLPVLPSVQAAMDQLKPDASAIYVPGNGTVTAMEEAIAAEVPLIIAVAEHIPVHDMLRIQQMLKTQSKTRLVGANCPGIISTHGKCRIGFQPLPFFQTGNIGIVAKSGTLSYETVASTTRAGLGQTYAISMGGDVLAGTTFIDAFKIFEHDDRTEGIIMVGEVGGRAEEDAAEWIREYRKRTSNPKPFMALIGGVQAPRGRVMGHAGAWAAPGEAEAADKVKVLEAAGVAVVDHPEKFGEGMKKLLAERTTGSKKASGPGFVQRRGYHTMRQRPRVQLARLVRQQQRTLYIKQNQALDMLKEKGIPVSETPSSEKAKLLAISIDRSAKSPCIIASPSTDPSDMYTLSKRFPFAYGSNEATSPKMLSAVSSHLGLSTPTQSQEPLSSLIRALHNIFMTKEAFVLETNISSSASSTLTVKSAHFGFDDAAFKSSGRQASVHALRDIQSEVPEEVAAEKEGMIYVKLPGEGTLGTIVNGAGLAMNTVDTLIARGGSPANFLDTGGKATSETIKAGFKIVVSDPRVKAIFVNIFGGLTLGDMIANGILMAFKDLDLKVPVVVRLRGTNERLGQEMIRNSGLKLDAFGKLFNSFP